MDPNARPAATTCDRCARPLPGPENAERRAWETLPGGKAVACPDCIDVFDWLLPVVPAPVNGSRTASPSF